MLGKIQNHNLYSSVRTFLIYISYEKNKIKNKEITAVNQGLREGSELLQIKTSMVRSNAVSQKAEVL